MKKAYRVTAIFLLLSLLMTLLPTAAFAADTEPADVIPVLEESADLDIEADIDTTDEATIAEEEDEPEAAPEIPATVETEPDSESEMSEEESVPTVVEYPAGELISDTLDGLKVTVSFDADVFPDGTTMSVEEIADEQDYNSALDDVNDLFINADYEDGTQIADTRVLEFKFFNADGEEIALPDGTTAELKIEFSEYELTEDDEYFIAMLPGAEEDELAEDIGIDIDEASLTAELDTVSMIAFGRIIVPELEEEVTTENTSEPKDYDAPEGEEVLETNEEPETSSAHEVVEEPVKGIEGTPGTEEIPAPEDTGNQDVPIEPDVRDADEITDGSMTAITLEDGSSVIIPREFHCFSYAGMDDTELIISSDLTFSGSYLDVNNGVDVPHYYCDFYGAFSKPTWVNSYTLSMRVSYLITEDPIGTEYYDNGHHYLCTEPNGLAFADEILIYLPGCPRSMMAGNFVSWGTPLFMSQSESSLPAETYGLYSINDEKGFVNLENDDLISIPTMEKKIQYIHEINLILDTSPGNVLPLLYNNPASDHFTIGRQDWFGEGEHQYANIWYFDEFSAGKGPHYPTETIQNGKEYYYTVVFLKETTLSNGTIYRLADDVVVMLNGTPMENHSWNGTEDIACKLRIVGGNNPLVL